MEDFEELMKAGNKYLKVRGGTNRQNWIKSPPSILINQTQLQRFYRDMVVPLYSENVLAVTFINLHLNNYLALLLGTSKCAEVEYIITD